MEYVGRVEMKMLYRPAKVPSCLEWSVRAFEFKIKIISLHLTKRPTRLLGPELAMREVWGKVNLLN